MTRINKSEKKNIGILTFHDGFNCGAFLQAFALQETIKSLGFSPQIINYKSVRRKYYEYRFMFITRRPRILLGNIKKYLKFKKAHQLLNLSRSLSEQSHLATLSYDAVIYGSDEIWNYSNMIVGVDPVYFGAGMERTSKVSYAPSCGNLDVNNDLPLVLKEGLRSFSSISVRDINSRDIVQEYSSIPVEIVLDPTFLYDFSAVEKICFASDFILVYSTGLSPELQNKAIKYARNKKKRIISIGYADSFCDVNVIGIGPLEFLGYFKAASEVITNTLHGTIFATKYNKPMAIISDSYRSNKLASIISTFKLESQIVRANGEGLGEALDNPINYQYINEKISEGSEKSINFLQSALKYI